MYQKVDGLYMEVVEFDTMPELPITGLTEMEAKVDYLQKMAAFNANTPYRTPFTGRCAEALTSAIQDGIISEPGKYGIHIQGSQYTIYNILE
jgi:hypothetical protein